MTARQTPLDPGTLLAGLIAPSAPGDSPAEATVDAAVELMATYGLRRWTMEDVARKAGLGRATVYRYFESRDELVAAALAREARVFFAAVAEAVSDVDGLEDKVAEGFLTGLELARRPVLSGLLAHDPEAAAGLLTSPVLLAAARDALVASCDGLPPLLLEGIDRDRLPSVAETLLRLGVSLLITPGTDLAEDTDELRQVVLSLLA